MNIGIKRRHTGLIGLALLALFLVVAVGAAGLPREWLRAINAGFVPLIAAGLLFYWARQRRRNDVDQRRQELALMRVEQALVLARSFEVDRQTAVEKAGRDHAGDGAAPSPVEAPDRRTLH